MRLFLLHVFVIESRASGILFLSRDILGEAHVPSSVSVIERPPFYLVVCSWTPAPMLIPCAHHLACTFLRHSRSKKKGGELTVEPLRLGTGTRVEFCRLGPDLGSVPRWDCSGECRGVPLTRGERKCSVGVEGWGGPLVTPN